MTTKHARQMTPAEYSTARKRAAAGALSTAETPAVAAAPKVVGREPDADDARVVRARLEAIARKAGIVDVDTLRLADMSSVRITESDDVVDGEEFVQSFKAARPYLFNS